MRHVPQEARNIMPNELEFRVDTQMIRLPDLARLLMAINALYLAAGLTGSDGEALASHLRETGALRVIKKPLLQEYDDSRYFRALAALNAWPVGHLATPQRSAT